MTENPVGPWYTDDKFRSYWTTYNQGRNWYRAHEVAYWKSKAMALQYENQCLHSLLQTSCATLDGQTFGEPRNPVVNLENTKVEDVLAKDDHIAPEYGKNDEGDDNEDFEMEITEEMLEFFEQSMKHRKEQKVLREAEDAIEYVNADSVSYEKKFADIYGSQLPARDVATEKDQEYARLYGNHAAKIQAMETSLDLTFHRHCSRKQPKLWPNIPLKL